MIYKKNSEKARFFGNAPDPEKATFFAKIFRFVTKM